MERLIYKLKPCYCGGLVELYEGHGYVQCAGCGLTTKSYRTDEKAVEGWNGNCR